MCHRSKLLFELCTHIMLGLALSVGWVSMLKTVDMCKSCFLIHKMYSVGGFTNECILTDDNCLRSHTSTN